MKRALLVLGLVMIMALGVGAAVADEHPPEHPHALVLGVVLDDSGEVPVSVRKCVDLAANRALPLNSHHAHSHTGRAGEALWGAGNAVVPLAPLTPWANCAELLAAFGL